MKETSFDWTDADDIAYFTSSEQKWINRLLRYASEKPEEVRILKRPEDNGGYMMASVPKSWGKIAPPKKHTMTDEQKRAASERMRKLRLKQISDAK